MTLAFGIKLPGLVPRHVATFGELPGFVKTLEDVGFDDVMDGEHILFAGHIPQRRCALRFHLRHFKNQTLAGGDGVDEGGIGGAETFAD